MTPEKAAQLKTHLDAIAQLLYEESDPAAMQTLEGIEMTVREQIQAHVRGACQFCRLNLESQQIIEISTAAS